MEQHGNIQSGRPIYQLTMKLLPPKYYSYLTCLLFLKTNEIKIQNLTLSFIFSISSYSSHT
jgi:hypothetical protein